MLYELGFTLLKVPMWGKLGKKNCTFLWPWTQQRSSESKLSAKCQIFKSEEFVENVIRPSDSEIPYYDFEWIKTTLINYYLRLVDSQIGLETF